MIQQPASQLARERRGGPRGELALVLSGGGARAAYQVGVLRHLARAHPDVRFDVMTGVSAGAINAAVLAAARDPFPQAVERLARLWASLSVEDVFEVSGWRLVRDVARWGTSLLSGGGRASPRVRGLVDAAPLARTLARALGAEPDGALPGIARNLEEGRCRAFALTTTRYATGQGVTFVQGRDIEEWQRSNRTSVLGEIRLEHVLASAALPLFFPAVRIGDGWYGDGGVRLAAPLSPALHLGASRLLAISARHERSSEEEARPDVEGYPPPARVAGLLLNAVFLDLLDQDADRLERINGLIEKVPEHERDGMRLIDHVVVRPSRDLGRLASDHEVELPRTFRFLLRGLGSRRVRSNDLLSLILFHGPYVEELMDCGERDARDRSEEIARLVAGP